MAVKTQGTIISIETARAATKAITGITNASPGVLTVVGNGYSNDDVVALDNIVGTVQLNKRAIIVSAEATDSITAKGVNTTNYGTYVSGGDSYKITLSGIGTVTGLPSLFTGTAPDIKTTHLLSVAEEKLQGLQDFGDFSMDILLDNADAGQAALRDAKEAQASKVFTIKLTDTKVAAFQAFVKSFSCTVAGNEAARATVQCSLQAAPSWFA